MLDYLFAFPGIHFGLMGIHLWIHYGLVFSYNSATTVWPRKSCFPQFSRPNDAQWAPTSKCMTCMTWGRETATATATQPLPGQDDARGFLPRYIGWVGWCVFQIAQTRPQKKFWDLKSGTVDGASTASNANALHQARPWRGAPATTSPAGTGDAGRDDGRGFLTQSSCTVYLSQSRYR